MLIDRDAAVKAIEQYGIAAINDGRKSLDTVDDIVELMRIVRAIPAAEQATRDEVKRDLPKDFGRWIPVTERLPDPKENPVLVVYGGCVWAAWKHDNYWELVPVLTQLVSPIGCHCRNRLRENEYGNL